MILYPRGAKFRQEEDHDGVLWWFGFDPMSCLADGFDESITLYIRGFKFLRRPVAEELSFKIVLF